MFVISLSSKKFKKTAVCCFIVAIVLVSSSVLIYNCIKNDERTKIDGVNVDNSAADLTEILSFVSSFGWEISSQPDEIREIIIPSEFDDVYKNYNEIQLSQGYNLEKFCGERVKRWTFTVSNYPGYEGKEFIKINILVSDGAVIGGDVCSVELNGFMHGFAKQ